MLKINKQSVDGLFPNKKEGYFKLKSDFCPSGDQKQAISDLIDGINKKEQNNLINLLSWKLLILKKAIFFLKKD